MHVRHLLVEPTNQIHLLKQDCKDDNFYHLLMQKLKHFHTIEINLYLHLLKQRDIYLQIILIQLSLLYP